MAVRVRSLRGSILFASCLLTMLAAAPAQAQFWQCVTFARAESGIQLFGNAWTWWDQADGKYGRGHLPEPGAVMVLKPGHGMRVGHVAIVSEIVDTRTVKLTHANWSRRGNVERDVTAVDVSDAGDWSKVRIWYAPLHDVGLTAYSVYGFIYPGEAPRQDDPAIIAKRDMVNAGGVQLASLASPSR